ncbi:unnamed protein product [Spirodela intermedia]|uniref:Uncharacterized protein n=1 Tax=Spirodela intermedia TaxID=51605 RepID=A0A7I8ISU4_SPIIN|nr:unnamed protein product [Spirodela intermedia]CAA6661052.1 unnamed protein product [Spirodela intermedia]
MLLGVRENFKRLRERIEDLEAFLDDADKKEIDDSSIHLWLSRLRTVLYDIDDLIDDCQFEADNLPRTQEDRAAGSSANCSHFIPSCISSLPFQHRIGSRIDSIDRRLEDIQKCQPPQLIVKSLTKGSNEECLLTYAIVGMEGIGKTTLAIKVFHDPRIQSHFEVKAWAILDSAMPDRKATDARESTESEVKKLVSGKRILLVLDDVWDVEMWRKNLAYLMLDSAMNSRLLITTRKEEVSKGMKSFKTYQKQERLQEFREIGMEIVEKCGGLPLAVNVVIGVLISKELRIDVWEAIRRKLSSKAPIDEGESSDQVIPALSLSYEDLPPNLKQCFLYCSLFPDDFRFQRTNLTQMWVAEGFLPKSEEDDAHEYFTRLKSRSLLQDVPEYVKESGGKMHDAVRNLAVHVCNKKYRFQQDSSKLPPGSRHLSRVRKGLPEAPSLKEMGKRVRTLLLFRNPSITRLNVSYTKLKGIPDSIQNLRNLQTFNLTGCESLKRLPNGISSNALGMGNLVKLRILNGFVANDVTQGENNMRHLKELAQLRDLAMYKLEAVTSMAVAQEAGLKNMQKLNNLRLSCTPRTDLRRENPEIQRIEYAFQGFSPPSRLEVLHIEWFFGLRFPVWINNNSLRHLRWLRLENCKFCQALPPLGKADLPSVTELMISKNRNLEEISNLPQLKTMDICNCPSIMQTNHLDVLTHLELDDSNMDTLPMWLTQTTSLQRLELVCSLDLLSHFCFADGEDRCKISNIPRIEAKSRDGSKYISYVKSPHSFSSNLTENINSSALA